MTEDEAKSKWVRGRPYGNYEQMYPLKERLLDKIIIDDNECWIWQGALNDCGYGRMKIKKRFKRAHRISWEVHNGPIPDGLVVDHLCMRRPCINPAHMEIVTRAENARRAMLYHYHGLLPKGYCGLAGKP